MRKVKRNSKLASGNLSRGGRVWGGNNCPQQKGFTPYNKVTGGRGGRGDEGHEKDGRLSYTSQN